MAVVDALSFYELNLNITLIFDDILVLFYLILILGLASNGVPLLNDLRHTEHRSHLCLSIPNQHHLTKGEETLLNTYNFQLCLLGTSIVVHGANRASHFYQNSLPAIIYCVLKYNTAGFKQQPRSAIQQRGGDVEHWFCTFIGTSFTMSFKYDVGI